MDKLQFIYFVIYESIHFGYVAYISTKEECKSLADDEANLDYYPCISDSKVDIDKNLFCQAIEFLDVVPWKITKVKIFYDYDIEYIEIVK